MIGNLTDSVVRCEMITTRYVVAENYQETLDFRLRELRDTLQAMFGREGFEFKLEEPSVAPQGVMAVVSNLEPGHAILNIASDEVSEFVQKWIQAHTVKDANVRDLV